MECIMQGPDEFEEADGQDLAEVFDETNITEDGEDIATSDMQRDLLDVTAADDDADADDTMAADADDFDPDALDEAEYEEIVQREEDLDEPRSFAGDDANRVLDEGESPADLEASDRDGAGLGDEDDTGAPPLP
jgi:hypothetical protein